MVARYGWVVLRKREIYAPNNGGAIFNSGGAPNRSTISITMWMRAEPESGAALVRADKRPIDSEL